MAKKKEELFKDYDGVKFQAEPEENIMQATVENLKVIEELDNGIYDPNSHDNVKESLTYLNFDD